MWYTKNFINIEDAKEDHCHLNNLEKLQCKIKFNSLKNQDLYAYEVKGLKYKIKKIIFNNADIIFYFYNILFFFLIINQNSNSKRKIDSY